MRAADLRDVFTDDTPRGVWVVSDQIPADVADTVRDAVRGIHNGYGPNDVVYELCADVWAWLVDHAGSDGPPTDDDDDTGRADDVAHMCADSLLGGSWCGYYDRRRWFAEYPGAADWVGDAVDNLGRGDSADDDIGAGLYWYARHIASDLWDVLAGLLVDSEPVGGLA